MVYAFLASMSSGCALRQSGHCRSSKMTMATFEPLGGRSVTAFAEAVEALVLGAGALFLDAVCAIATAASNNAAAKMRTFMEHLLVFGCVGRGRRCDHALYLW